MGFTYGEVLKFIHGAGLKFAARRSFKILDRILKILCRARELAI
ncbi:hypothetical protein [uncultured Campylobacter sp.]|nr:hypothetical protein [uncultured Campylobacter sp.]